jgi:hypothetical protein
MPGPASEPAQQLQPEAPKLRPPYWLTQSSPYIKAELPLTNKPPIYIKINRPAAELKKIEQRRPAR